MTPFDRLLLTVAYKRGYRFIAWNTDRQKMCFYKSKAVCEAEVLAMPKWFRFVNPGTTYEIKELLKE